MKYGGKYKRFDVDSCARLGDVENVAAIVVCPDKLVYEKCRRKIIASRAEISLGEEKAHETGSGRTFVRSSCRIDIRVLWKS